MSITYRELIQRGARHHAEKVAIVFGDSQLTFREVDELSNQFGHALGTLGIVHGEMLALLMNNGLYSVPLEFACAKAGINRVPINARLSLHEQTRMLQETGCRRLLYAADLAQRAAELGEQLPGLQTYAIGPSANELDLLALAAKQSSAPLPHPVEPTDKVFTLFTSGTTGSLKAAQHTQASYAAICQNILQNLMDIQADDVILHAASLIHASGVFVLPFWLRGARTVILPSFDPASYLQTIHEKRVTTINLVPTMLQMLLEHSAFNPRHLPSLRHIAYGASPMPRPVIERAIGLFGQQCFWQYYGQTECPLAIAALRPEDHVPGLLGACGRPSTDMEIRLVDAAGQEVPSGEEGEIAVRSPSMMAGYFNAPELNREMFIEGGWLRTRDIGVFDQRGYLHLKDRTSDMIITGGYNVYPREIEDLLLAHSALAECAVIGCKDPKWVEAVTAVVVLKPGCSVSEEELIEFVAGQVASYKKPQRVLFASNIPKTSVGKINRRALREALAVT